MLHLRTFGGASLISGGVPLAGSAAQKRRLALLALLAAAGERGMSRDKLAALLWPESDQERARHSLSQWLFTTRRELRIEDLLLGSAELRLNPQRITSDVREFETAIQAGDHGRALEQYAGPFLDGFHLTGATEFERWSDGERARLAGCYERALEAIAAQRTAAGDARGALELWQRRAAADPFNGRVSLALMRAFEDAGDTAGALSHARVHATLLREELGAEPQPDVVAYAERLRVAPAARMPAPADAGAALPAVPSAPRVIAGVPVAPAVSDMPVVPPGAHATAPSPPAGLSPAPSSRATRRRRLVRRSAYVALGLSVLMIGAWTTVPSGKRELIRTLIARDEPEIVSRRIVVAPFRDLTGDTALATFGLIASSRVTTALADADLFQVVDEQTAFVNDMVLDSIPRVLRWVMRGDRAVSHATEAGAGLLVSGEYSRQGDSIRMDVRLTNLAAGRFTNALALAGARGEEQVLIDALAQRVVSMAAAAVDTSVAGDVLRGTIPVSYASYDDAAKAWIAYTEGDLAGFYRYARSAWRRDTSYMRPVLMQAHVRSDSRQWSEADSLVQVLEAHRTGMSKLEDAATDMLAAAVAGDMTRHLRGAIAVTGASPSAEVRTYAARVAVNANQPLLALRLLGEVNTSRGAMLVRPWYWNWASAAHHLRGDHASELTVARAGARKFPRVETAVAGYGRALAVHGNGKELESLRDRLPRVGAADAHRRWKIVLDWTREQRAHGHPGEARRLLEALHAELSTGLAQRHAAADRFRATVLGDLGRVAEAHALWSRLAASDPASLEITGNMGVAAARAGDTTVARQVERRIAGRDWPYAHGRDAMWQARIMATLGELDPALMLVETALEEGYSRFFDPGGGIYDEPDLHVDPALAPLRRLPAFVRVLEPKG